MGPNQNWPLRTLFGAMASILQFVTILICQRWTFDRWSSVSPFMANHLTGLSVKFIKTSLNYLLIHFRFEIGRVQDFLGLKRIITEKYFYFNTSKGFPCLIKSESRSSPHCLGKSKGRNHPYISPNAYEQLKQFYRPFNMKFYRMTGIDFGWS